MKIQKYIWHLKPNLVLQKLLFVEIKSGSVFRNPEIRASSFQYLYNAPHTYMAVLYHRVVSK